MAEVVEVKNFMILPATPGTCAMCATKHDEDLAHNQTSLFYQTRFYMKWGRYPTWADACAHLDVNRQRQWRTAMRGTEAEWTEPEDGEAIAEPYAMSDPFRTSDLPEENDP